MLAEVRFTALVSAILACIWPCFAVAADGAKTVVPEVVNAASLDCNGKRLLQNYDRTLTVDVPLSVGGAPEDQAARQAHQELLLRLLGGDDCAKDALSGLIKEMKGRDDKRQIACAQAMIKDSDYDGWLNAHRPAGAKIVLHGELKAMVGKIENNWKNGKRKPQKPTIAIYDWADADRNFLNWISGFFNESIKELEPDWKIVPPKGHFDGAKLPKDLDILLMPKLFRLRTDQLNYEVVWEAYMADESKLSPQVPIGRTEVSKCVVPPPPPPPPAPLGPVTLEMQLPRADFACEGDTIAPFLLSAADKDMHVRVIDLWGNKDGAMVMWPASPDASDIVKPGDRLPLTAEGDAIVLVTPSAVPFERYLVFASADSAELDNVVGRLQSNSQCVFDAKHALRWHNLKKSPTSTVQMTEMRLEIRTGGKCGDIDLNARALVLQELAKLPICK